MPPFEPIEPGQFQPVDAGESVSSNLVRVLGNTTGSLVGNDPRSGQALLLQCGSDVVTTDGSGNATVIFPTPFPGGVVTVLVTNGDAGVNAFRPGVTGTTKSNFSGAFEVLSTEIRLNWIAIGF
jgi:hypothetical protein